VDPRTFAASALTLGVDADLDVRGVTARLMPRFVRHNIFVQKNVMETDNFSKAARIYKKFFCLGGLLYNYVAACGFLGL
jgi:hypothetical protein